jgi:transcriptional regulator with GAF, ATPase, and Fis domain
MTKVDVRIIAATNRDLEMSVKDGKFRDDLFYRLNVFPLVVPPLRERSDDIPLLAAAFAKRYATRLGRAIDTPSEQCLQRLQAYDWPGNVRELENIIERAVITSRDGRLNLERALPEASSSEITCRTDRDSQVARRVRTVQELQDEERENLVLALESTGWRVAGDTGAAKLLGLRPSTLNSRMRALGIERPR